MLHLKNFLSAMLIVWLVSGCGGTGSGSGDGDTTPPVITLIGSAEVNVTKDDTYTDAGATATDERDGNITGNIVTVNPVDTNTVGTYTVTYNVQDSAGNVATEVKRTVNVQLPPDTTPPVITILGDNPITTDQGQPYNDPGATATDDIDGNLTNRITTTSTVNVDVAGDYYVVYTVADDANNTATATRRVTVRAVSVSLSLSVASSDDNITEGETFTLTVSEANGKSFTVQKWEQDGVDLGSTANPLDAPGGLAVGTYHFTAYVSDSRGFEHNVTISVTVHQAPDTTRPVITLNGSAEVNVTVGDNYTDAGATANDNVDGDITGSIVTVSDVNTSAVGTYHVTYNVTDTAGNVATEVVRTVNVQPAPDTTKPVITLLGAATVNLTTGDTYTDAGATASDDRDGDITARIVTHSDVNTSQADTYHVTYNVADNAGNVADEVVRTVIVTDPQPIALDLNITATPAQPVEGEDFNLSVTENAGLTFTDPQWSGDVSGSDANITVAGGLTAGDHNVTIRVKDTNGFEHNKTVTLTVVTQPPVSMTLTIDTNCTTEDGNDCTLTAESNVTISDVRWSGDSVDGASGNPLVVTGGYAAGDHSVDVNVSDSRGYRHLAHLDFHIDPLGAISLSLEINATGWFRPSSDENGTRDIHFAGESNDTAHIASWSWDLGDGLTASDQNATRRYTAEGNYTVILTATDTNGFDHTATADVNITAYNTVERWIKSHNGTAVFEYEADFSDVTSTTGGSSFEDDGAGKLVPSGTPCHFQRDSQGNIITASVVDSSELGHFCLTWTPDDEHYVIVDYKEHDDPNSYYAFLHYDDGTGYGTLPYDERRIYTVEEHRINQVYAGATDVDGNKHGLGGMDNNTSLYLYSE